MSEMVPKLRFKQDDGSDFPVWKETTLEEVAKYRRGSFPQPYGLAEWYDDENGTPFVQVYDVDNNFRLKPTTKRKISELAKKQSVFIPKNSLILTIQGSIGRIAITQYDAYVDRTLLIFTGYKQPIDVRFFAQVIFLLFEIEKRKAPGGTIKTITKEALSSFALSLPVLKEQQKIASFLSAVDEKIGHLKRRLELLQTYKRGVMQKLFSQEVRFKREDGSAFPDWEAITFDEVARRVPDKFDPVTSDEKPNLVELENIEAQTGKIISVSFIESETSTKTRFRKNDVLFGKLRPYLKKYAYTSFAGVCSSEIWVLRGLKVCNQFLYYLIQTDEFMKLANQSTGSKMPRADWQIISSEHFDIPSSEEQQKIASFLSAIDSKLDAVSTQISQMQRFKKGLLQQMFV